MKRCINSTQGIDILVCPIFDFLLVQSLPHILE